jgi:TPR repeat protein
MPSYNRGDYVPAIRLFRPLAEQGNAKAQSALGVMYRRGEGVARSSVRAFIWFSRAAARGARRRQGEGGIARCVANHDARGTFAGPRDGASL